MASFHSETVEGNKKITSRDPSRNEIEWPNQTTRVRRRKYYLAAPADWWCHFWSSGPPPPRSSVFVQFRCRFVLSYFTRKNPLNVSPRKRFFVRPIKSIVARRNRSDARGIGKRIFYLRHLQPNACWPPNYSTISRSKYHNNHSVINR